MIDPLSNWARSAACVGVNPEVFYPKTTGGGSIRSREAVNRAKTICASCPVRKECLEDALTGEIPSYRFGVWGGLTPQERAKVADRRDRVAS